MLQKHRMVASTMTSQPSMVLPRKNRKGTKYLWYGFKKFLSRKVLWERNAKGLEVSLCLHKWKPDKI